MSKLILTRSLSVVSLLCLLACGGGGSDTPTPVPTSSSIAYINPSNVPATSYYLTKNTTLSSPGSHLVLDLFGPTTPVSGSGVVITLTLDTTKATWSSTPLIKGSLFSSTAIVRNRLTGANNATLQAVVAEQGVGAARAFTGGPLLQIALDLKSGQAVGSAINLSVDLTKSKVVLQGTPQDTGLPTSLDLRVGTLTCQ